MENSLVIQGHEIGPADLEQVRVLLADHLDWSRYLISREMCMCLKLVNHILDPGCPAHRGALAGAL